MNNFQDTDNKLAEDLRRLYELNDEGLRARFQRSLPFADGFFDRWERAKRLGFAQGTSVYNSTLIFGDVTVGACTWIGPYVLLDGSGGGIEIGSHCSISAGVQIYTHDTVYWALSGGQLERRVGAVRIGSCVYIGSQSVIERDVSIGDRCVVAANSFVRTDVPTGTVVAGSPAQRIGLVVGVGAQVRICYDRPQHTMKPSV